MDCYMLLISDSVGWLPDIVLTDASLESLAILSLGSGGRLGHIS